MKYHHTHVHKHIHEFSEEEVDPERNQYPYQHRDHFDYLLWRCQNEFDATVREASRIGYLTVSYPEIAEKIVNDVFFMPHLSSIPDSFWDHASLVTSNQLARIQHQYLFDPPPSSTNREVLEHNLKRYLVYRMTENKVVD